MKKTPLQDYAGDLLLSWLFAFGLLWGAFHSLQYRFPAGIMALCVLVFAGVWLLMLRVPWAAFAICLILMFIVLFWEIPTFNDPERLQVLLIDWGGFLSWINAAVLRQVPNPPQEYLQRALLLMSLGAALITGLLVRVRTHPAVFLLVGGGVFFAQEAFLNKLFFPAFVLFLCTLALYTLRQSYAGRRRRVQKAAPPLRFLLGAAPICLLAVGLAVLLPSRQTPLGQPILDWINGWESSQFVDIEIGQFTYNDLKKRDADDELGGPLRRNSTLLLRVRADRATYLKAHAYDVYTGRSWRASEDVVKRYISLERAHITEQFDTGLIVESSLPTAFPLSHGTLAGGYQRLTGAYLHALSGEERPPLDKLFAYTWEQADVSWFTSDAGLSLTKLFSRPDAIAYRNQTITFENIRTDSIFLPNEAVGVTLTPSTAAQVLVTFSRSTLGDMYMSERQGDQFSYTTETCELNLTRSELGDLLRLSEGEMPKSPKGRVFLREMQDYAAWEAEQLDNFAYREVSESVPARVTELAENLTGELSTDYDKALAIETYLSTSFPYDIDVPETPPERDFVDYFLFDLQRGYCTYYATAMTVLCRAAGLPARYVEGFAPAADRRTPGLYNVTGEQAHAWCEVFFPGFGWVPFEPTASYGESFEERYFGTSTPPPIEPPTPSAQQTPSPTPSAGERTPEDVGTPPGWLLAVLAVLAFLCVTPVVQLIRRGRLVRGSRAAETLYGQSIRLARCLGVSAPAPSETPLEWARRVNETVQAPPDAGFVKAAVLYNRARYASDRTDDRVVAALHRRYEKLLSRWRTNIPKMKYVLYRHYLGWL